MAMDTSPDLSISYTQLFSFQISYTAAFLRSNSSASPDDKKGDYWQGILEVDFHMETLFIQDRDRIFMSQPFSTLRNHVDADYVDGCSISIKFDSEQWNVISQNVAEKTCIQHLLECIVNGSSIDEALQIGKEKGIIGLDRSIQKHGQILRRAINHNKLEERFLILVPGKLLLFKNFDVIGRHARYVTSLFGATLRTSPEEQEFQVSAPGSKTLSLISPDPGDFDSWVEAVQASIEYTKQAARAAGMATSLPKKKRRSRASRSHRIQWDTCTLDKDSQPLESGNGIRSNVEAAQLNPQQSEAEAVMPIICSDVFQEEYCYKKQPRSTKQENRETKETRKQSKAMMCLETALNEMTIAVSSIRTVRLPGPALWHKANVSPPRFNRGYEEHLQSGPDREGRRWQPSVCHNYVDALISPRTRETLVTSQPLRRSWDSTSTVDTGAGFPREVRRSQTMEDLRSSLPMSREEEILRWRNGSCPTQVSIKSAMSQPRTGQQRKSAQLDPEQHGITSSDDEDNCGGQSTGADLGNSSTRVPTDNSKVTVSLNSSIPDSANSFTKITGLPCEYLVSGNAFRSHSGMMDPHVDLPQQQFLSFGPTVNSTLDPTRTENSVVTSLDPRPSRVSRVSFYPRDDVINIVEGEPSISVPNLSNGETRTLNSRSMQFESLKIPGKLSERDVKTISNAQACAVPASRIDTGLHGKTSSSSDTQRIPTTHYESAKTPAQQPPIFHQSVPFDYFPHSEFSSEGKSLIMEVSQHGNTRQSEAPLSINGSIHLRDPYRFIQNSTMVVPNSTMPEYSDISRRSTQEAGVSTPTRRLSEMTSSQGTIQSAEIPKQEGAVPPPSRQPGQTLLYQELTQETNSLNGHTSRRNSSASSVSIPKVQLDHFTTSPFSVESNGASTSEASGYVPNTTLLRNSSVLSDPTAVKNSDIGQTFISGPELLSRRQSHDALTRQQSYLQGTPDGGQRFSQPPAYPAGQLSSIEPENTTERVSMPLPSGHYNLEREAVSRSSYGPPHITNGGVMRDQAGAEEYARAQTGLCIYAMKTESGACVNPEISMSSADNIVAPRHLEGATASAQFNDVAELVNRLVRITAGDEPIGDKTNLPGVRNLDTGSLSADALPPSSMVQDSLSRTWERPVNTLRVPGDATPAYHVPAQRSLFEPSSGGTSVQTVQGPHAMLSSSDQDINPALQLQAFSLLGGIGTPINHPITLTSADGEVIIIGKERRSSTVGLAPPQGADQVQTNIGVAAQEERLQDSRQPSRRPSLAGDMGSSSNGEVDAWSLAILKPGTPAQIFKFETASLEAP